MAYRQVDHAGAADGVCEWCQTTKCRLEKAMLDVIAVYILCFAEAVPYSWYGHLRGANGG